MKSLRGKGYKDGDDVTSVAEGEPSFNTLKDCLRITSQSIKKHWYKD